jgi:hypothetical protein
MPASTLGLSLGSGGFTYYHFGVSRIRLPTIYFVSSLLIVKSMVDINTVINVLAHACASVGISRVLPFVTDPILTSAPTLD